MHIPDGFLNNNVSGPLLAGALGALAHAFVRVKSKVAQKIQIRRLATFPPSNTGTETRTELTQVGQEKLMRMATVGALIFAAQMMNFPVAQGTSGHFLGGLFAALVLGPWAGLLVIGVVLAVQALMFGDGGIVAFGANVVNMGLVATLGGWYLFKSLRIVKNFLVRTGIVAWATVVLAAIATSVELAVSGTIPFSQVFRAMVSVHVLIGLGEAALTILFVAYLRKRNQPIAALQKTDGDEVG